MYHVDSWSVSGIPLPLSSVAPESEVKLLGVKCVACSEKADFIASLQAKTDPVSFGGCAFWENFLRKPKLRVFGVVCWD